MKHYLLPGVFYILLVGCSGTAPQPSQSNAPRPVARLRTADLGWKFPPSNQVSVTLVDARLLGKDFMPGGNLGEYADKGKKYQLFLVRAASPDEALGLLLSLKKGMTGAKFIPHMGGYFGNDSGKALYAFQKGLYLAGVVGLPETEADLQARQFAARLN